MRKEIMPRQWLKLSTIVLLATTILGLNLLYLANAETADGLVDDLRGDSINLSRTATLENQDSGAPVMAAQGSTLAVVWSDELLNDTVDTTTAGHIYLKSGDQDTSSGYWRPKVKVFTGTLNTLADQPAMIFDRSVAGKVHLVWLEGRFESDPSSGDNFWYDKVKYTTCDVSGDVNTCQKEKTIATSSNDKVKYRSPVIAQDDANNLHVVWVDSSNNSTLRYIKGITGSGSFNWTGIGAAEDASGMITNADNPKLIYNNGRLHLVWDDKSGNIKYIYDGTSDALLKADGQQTWSNNYDDDDFDGGDPGNPSIVALNNRVYIAFGIKHPTDNPRKYALVYARSDYNGNDLSWYDKLVSIPDGKTDSFTKYQPSGDNSLTSLYPALAVDTTGVYTRLHAMWQYYDGSHGGHTDIYYAWIITDTFTAPWNSEGAVTNNADSSRIADVTRIQGENTASIDPALAIASVGGLSKLNMAFLEKPGNNDKWDIHYRGGIAGTIDPAYLLDTTFNLTATVNPGHIQTGTNTIPQLTMTYIITIANTGPLDAVGVGITDTFTSYPDGEVGTIFAPAALHGNVGVVGNKLTWIADGNKMESGQTEILEFTMRSNGSVPVPTTFNGRVVLWNPADNDIMRENAYTTIQKYTIYLPVVFKN